MNRYKTTPRPTAIADFRSPEYDFADDFEAWEEAQIAKAEAQREEQLIEQHLNC